MGKSEFRRTSFKNMLHEMGSGTQITKNDLKQVVEVVGATASELSHSFHFLRLAQISIEAREPSGIEVSAKLASRRWGHG